MPLLFSAESMVEAFLSASFVFRDLGVRLSTALARVGMETRLEEGEAVPSLESEPALEGLKASAGIMSPEVW